MSLNARLKARVLAFDAAVRPWARRSRAHAAAYEFLLFGLKQAWACLFAGAMLALLIATELFWPHGAPLARYDVLVLAAVVLQGFMLATRLERWDEALVIAVFHVVGTAMEVFKTAHGSWIYPEASLLRIGGAPLFSGFMYAAIGSYLARAWRLFELRFEGYPPAWGPWLLAVAAYLNFFTHHYVMDVRLALYVASFLLFARARFVFTPDRTPRRMPMLLGFLLVAVFIWIAENVGTVTRAWTYPSQAAGWRPVPVGKVGAWYLLILLSFVLVSLVRRPRAPGEGASTNPLTAPLQPPRRGGRGAISGSRSPGSAGAASGRS